MYCTSCGATLPVGATSCPSCSTPTPYNIRTPLPDDPDAAKVSSHNYNPYAGSVLSPPGSPSYGTPQQNVSSINLAAGVSQATAPGSAAYQAAQPLPYPHPPVQGRPPGGRSAIGFMTILLIIITLLVMASGLGLIYYSAVYHPAQIHAQATATAQVLQTAQAQATALANTQATGTAQANATAQAVATAQVVATATALQNIYNQATSGPPAFSDPMNGSNTGNWQIGDGSQGGGCHFVGGAYHVTVTVKNYYFACFAQNTNFTNFAFQVKMTIVKGDEGGIIFRGNDSNSKFYSFGASRDGLFSLLVTRSNTSNKPLILGPNAAIKANAGQANLLTVVARGSNIYLYINKQYVDSVHDTTYNAGEIGVYASDNKNPTDVAFNNVQVWKF